MRKFSGHGIAAAAGLAMLAGYHASAHAQTYKSLKRADGAHTPVKIYGGAGCRPVMVLSHGFGGSREGLASLANAAARAGYRVYAMGHAESGRKQLRQVLRSNDRRAALIRQAGDPGSHRARFLDLDAVWKAAIARCRPPFSVFAGHSMGAQTVMMEAGALARIGAMGRDRFDAYIAMSPQGVGLRFSAGAWRGVRKPVLMITGTRDRGVDGGYRTRVTAFDGLPGGRKRLAIISGANHRNIGGRGVRKAAAMPPIIAMAFCEKSDQAAAQLR